MGVGSEAGGRLHNYWCKLRIKSALGKAVLSFPQANAHV
jgi:hypothetical protein